MKIEEAKIFSFGKLQNVSFRFKEGINVIYGANEQGKTTLHTFLIGMLFGIEKSRGRSAKGDVYSRYEPWHAASFYSGALRFRVDGKPFYLERNFYSKDKRAYLRNEEDGEELNVAYGDLDVLLGGIGREQFENTYDVPQSGAVTGRAMSELLTAYLAEAESGGNGTVSILLAKKHLAAGQRELAGELRILQEERRKAFEQKEMELSIQKEHAEELRQQIQIFEEEQQELYEKLSFREENGDKRIRFLASAGLLAVAVMAGGLAFLKIVSWIAAVFVGLLAAVIIWMLLKGEADVCRRMTKSSACNTEDDAENNELLRHAKQMLEQLKEHLQENENVLINIEEEKKKLEQIPLEELELQEDIEALKLAESQIEKISKDYYLEVADELNGEVSKWISLLTKGAYDSAGLDKDGRLWILAEERETVPESLSRGTLEQIYLALRLAVGTVMMQEEEMPIFLDEAFAMYDDERLTETLKALAKTKKQIFIFTCQKREEALLRWAEIPYHAIDMTEKVI